MYLGIELGIAGVKLVQLDEDTGPAVVSVRHGRLDFVVRMPRFRVQASTFPETRGPNWRGVDILLP